ncbi:hypothetical protein [Candidatus Uabimicrobium amorphum]|uniref:hypothetical protein n=1 Tax=Uabimicrobium amorphum TaxID=2596890 RepID=UPI00125ECFCA|nr:hypothetical protein [Candidatus Uabimicrobium amorphum]
MNNQIVKIIYELQQDIKQIKQQLSIESINKRYTLEEVAELSGRCVQTIKNHKRAGFLKERYPLAKKKFDAKDVDNYLRGCKEDRHER